MCIGMLLTSIQGTEIDNATHISLYTNLLQSFDYST